jgi:hypothetical protein
MFAPLLAADSSAQPPSFQEDTMPTPSSFHGHLQLPGDAGLSPTPIPMTMASHFVAELVAVYPLQGAGLLQVPLGTLGPAGLKG